MYVSVREVIVTHAGYNTVIEGLRELDVWAVELAIDREMTVASLTEAKQRLPLRTDADVDAYRRHLEENNVRVSALLLANNFNAPDLEGELNWVIESIWRAHKLGCDAVRIDSAMPGEVDLPFDERVERVVQCLKRVIAATEDTEMPLGIENHGRQGNDPAFLDAVMEGVGSPRLGLTLDTGNFYWYGHPLSQVYEIEQRYAPYTKHTHLKNICFPEELREQRREPGWGYGEYVCPIPDGDVDHTKIVSFLRDAGYTSDLCIEDESLGKFPPEQRKDVLRRDVEYVKSLI